GQQPFVQGEPAYLGYNLTLDAGNIHGSGYFESYVKYAYLEMGNMLPGLVVRFGQNPTPWVGYEEHLWGFRFLSKVFVDLFGYMSSTDRGLSVLYRPASGKAEVHLSVVNGEGYHGSEVNASKDVMGRLSVFPLAGSSSFLSGLGLHVYGQQGRVTTDTVRNRYIAGLSLVGDLGRIMGEWIQTQDGASASPRNGQGYSLFGSVDLGRWLMPEAGRSFGVLFRYDQRDPNTSVSNDGTRMVIGRLFVRPCLFLRSLNNVVFAVNVLHYSYEDPAKQADTYVRFNAEVKF
ncbi:MAG: hypothetical protein L3J76_02495, partial [Candidatus Hydrothermae bacterium]|nr:hypothetical protein [Candidatus Hydrothermae bacterium]